MKTALATDDPDEPDRGGYLPPSLTVATNTTGTTEHIRVSSTFDPIRLARQSPPATTATFPQRIVGPWQCPDCKTWMAPTVTEHRCP